MALTAATVQMATLFSRCRVASIAARTQVEHRKKIKPDAQGGLCGTQGYIRTTDDVTGMLRDQENMNGPIRTLTVIYESGYAYTDHVNNFLLNGFQLRRRD